MHPGESVLITYTKRDLDRAPPAAEPDGLLYEV